jgi:mannosyltransferase OCH1-like enzyme
MFKKWKLFSESKNINLNIYSNKQVNEFMKENFEDDLIYDIYKKSIIPVQKIDIFRICCIYLYGGIWLDLKSEINLHKVLSKYNESDSNGILIYEPRKIEIINLLGNKQLKTFEHVIHNGFFFLPKKSKFLEKLLLKIKKDFLYFQDIVFKYPKQGIMNLTGPHQFTRTYHELKKTERPKLVSHEEIDWNYLSKYGEFLSPFNIFKKHYSSLKELKTIDSKKYFYLK